MNPAQKLTFGKDINRDFLTNCLSGITQIVIPQSYFEKIGDIDIPIYAFNRISLHSTALSQYLVDDDVQYRGTLLYHEKLGIQYVPSTKSIDVQFVAYDSHKEIRELKIPPDSPSVSIADIIKYFLGSDHLEALKSKLFEEGVYERCISAISSYPYAYDIATKDLPFYSDIKREFYEWVTTTLVTYIIKWEKGEFGFGKSNKTDGKGNPDTKEDCEQS